MSDNVGLSTPRGSGTSGYVQKNRAFIRPRDGPPPGGFHRDLEHKAAANRFRQPDQGILDHGRKRAIEVEVFALRDELEEKGELDDDEIDKRCDALRDKLSKEGSSAAPPPRPEQRRFKTHQVHEQARAKIEETERIRRALHINKDYKEGGHWRRQEEKLAQKRKKEEDEAVAEAEAEAAAEREREQQQRNQPQRRRYSDGDDDKSDRGSYSGGGSDDGDDDAEDGEIRGPPRAPPARSVERDIGDRRRRHDYDDDDDDKRSDYDSDRGRGRQDGRRVRQRRDPSSSRSDSRSLSRSRSRSRSRTRSSSGSRRGGRRD